MDNVHRCGISKRIPQVALDFTLRRQVQLLKQLGRHVDARRGTEPVESLSPVRVGVDADTVAFFVCHGDVSEITDRFERGKCRFSLAVKCE